MWYVFLNTGTYLLSKYMHAQLYRYTCTTNKILQRSFNTMVVDFFLPELLVLILHVSGH